MKRHSYVLILVFSGLLSCEKQPPMDPWMVKQVFIGEVNGVPFQTGMTIQHAAFVSQEMCIQDVVAISLIRKISEKEYQRVHMNYFHTRPGNYTLTDSAVSHRENATMCILDSISIGGYFLSEPADDTPSDAYRLLEGPWNYFKLLYYDPKKSELQGQFEAKFVRINRRQHAREAVDTITYTNTKFILSNIYVQEVFTEPR